MTQQRPTQQRPTQQRSTQQPMIEQRLTYSPFDPEVMADHLPGLPRPA